MKKLPFILSVLLSCLSVQALIAYDDASDIVYSDGWDNMDNGGSGFGAWIMNSWSDVQSNYFGISSSTEITAYHQQKYRLRWCCFQNYEFD